MTIAKHFTHLTRGGLEFALVPAVVTAAPLYGLLPATHNQTADVTIRCIALLSFRQYRTRNDSVKVCYCCCYSVIVTLQQFVFCQNDLKSGLTFGLRRSENAIMLISFCKNIKQYNYFLCTAHCLSPSLRTFSSFLTIQHFVVVLFLSREKVTAVK